MLLGSLVFHVMTPACADADSYTASAGSSGLCQFLVRADGGLWAGSFNGRAGPGWAWTSDAPAGACARVLGGVLAHRRLHVGGELDAVAMMGAGDCAISEWSSSHEASAVTHRVVCNVAHADK